jgi:hypothetical protein
VRNCELLSWVVSYAFALGRDAMVLIALDSQGMLLESPDVAAALRGQSTYESGQAATVACADSRACAARCFFL